MFDRIDVTKQGVVNWDKFASHMLLEFYEKDDKVKSTQVPHWTELKVLATYVFLVEFSLAGRFLIAIYKFYLHHISIKLKVIKPLFASYFIYNTIIKYNTITV